MSDLGNKEVFALNLQNMMNKKNVKAVDVCKALNISKSTYSNWLNAKIYPRIDKIEMLAIYFNCKKSELVEREYELPSVDYYVLDGEEEFIIECYRKNPKFKDTIKALLEMVEK